jgi:hypothetical protein
VCANRSSYGPQDTGAERMNPTGQPIIKESSIPTKTRPSAEHEVLTANHFLVAH